MLELFTREEIRIEKLNPGVYAAECDWPGSCANPEREVRDVLLCGQVTGLPYVFAHTHLFPEALAPAVRAGLSQTSNPIGKVLKEHRVETFRQIEQRGCRAMPAVAEVLGGAATDQLQWRRYSVTSRGLVILEITEAFSAHLFDPSGEPA
jgi:chorismate-pyruvate lyase